MISQKRQTRVSINKEDTMVEVGAKATQTITVDSSMTAARMGSGALEVFATPFMIALMEGTSKAALDPYLAEGQGSVGTNVNVSHMAATPVGMQVTCEAEVIEVDRRRVVFAVKAYDEEDMIGEGTHERFVIDNEKFFAKVQAKFK